MSDCLSLFSFFSWLTCDSNFTEERQTACVCSARLLSLTLSDRRFIVLKSAVVCRLPSLLIKAVFSPFFLARQLGQVTGLLTQHYKYR